MVVDIRYLPYAFDLQLFLTAIKFEVERPVLNDGRSTTEEEVERFRPIKEGGLACRFSFSTTLRVAIRES